MRISLWLSASLLTFIIFTTNTNAFNDEPAEAWCAEHVSQLQNLGIIDEGISYRPSEGLIRAELMKMVIKATTDLSDYNAPPTDTFDDVSSGAWFAPYIETGASLGIALGYKDQQGSLTGKFGPADAVTRAAAAKILVMAFDLEAETTGSFTQIFSDVPEGEWFTETIHIAQKNGLVTGYPTGDFKPHEPVTRAEMAKMLNLAIGVSSKETAVEMIETNEPEKENEGAAEVEVTEVLEEVSSFFQANATVLNSELMAVDENEHLVTRYNFEGNKEGFLLSTLTIANDLLGTDFGDQPQASLAIKKVIIRYADENGMSQRFETVLNNQGLAKFSNLNFFIPEDELSPLEVYVTLNDFAEIGSQLSGETIRLGLKNTDNSIETFRAVGEFSGNMVTSGGGALQITGSEPDYFTVRKSHFNISSNPGTGNLISGSSELISLNLRASEFGAVSLGRLVFEISINDAADADMSVDDFEVRLNNNLIDHAIIYDPSGAQELSSGSLTHGSRQIIVSFDEEVIIPAGETLEFTLEAVVVNANSNDNVVTRLVENDQNNTLNGLTAANQSNTGKIYVDSDVTSGIFTNSTDFSQVVGNNRNIIWSDLSDFPHNYPSISAGNVTDQTGSNDWTNGYFFDMSGLENSVLTK